MYIRTYPSGLRYATGSSEGILYHPQSAGDSKLSRDQGENVQSIASNKNNIINKTKKLVSEFYKKLIQADAQIAMLKKGVADLSMLKVDDNKLKNMLDRTKRSLSIDKTLNGNVIDEKMNKKRSISSSKRSMKAIDNNIKNVMNSSMSQSEESETANKIENTNHFVRNSDEVDRDETSIDDESFVGNSSELRNKRLTKEQNKLDEGMNGIVIEKKKILVKYKPVEHRKVPKCSHVPKESKSHEKQLKHPFYKNTQRLDELLDKFMENSIPEIITEPFGNEVFSKSGCKHSNINRPKVVDKNEMEKAKSKVETPREVRNNDLNEYTNDDGETIRTTVNYGVDLSISTISNPIIKTAEDIRSNRYLERGLNFRKLMQADEVEEENIGYEDLKEVLADDLETHDDTENLAERNKRNENSELHISQRDLRNTESDEKEEKESIPLYSDEIKFIINQAALSANTPTLFQTYQPDSDKLFENKVGFHEKSRNDVDDVQYLEDYSYGKQDKMAEMAQAYSDYGVLDGKKESIRNDKNDVKSEEHRVKLSVDNDFTKSGIFKRSKKGTEKSEGIKFELRPSGSSRNKGDDSLDVYKYINKHVKYLSSKNENPLNKKENSKSEQPEITISPINSNIENVNNEKNNDKTESAQIYNNKYKNGIPNNNLIYTISKGKRSLKSVDYENDFNTKDESTNDNLYYEDIINLYKHETLTDLKENLMNTTEHHIQNNNLTTYLNENITIGSKEDALSDTIKFESYSSFFTTNTLQNNTNIESEHLIFKRDMINNFSFVNDQKINTNSYKLITVFHNDSTTTETNKHELENINYYFPNNNTQIVTNEMSIGDFFIMLTNFFSFLEKMDVPNNNTYSEASACGAISKSDVNKFENMTELSNPVYNSGIIDNIGHLSRVLLSVEEKNVTDNVQSDPNNAHSQGKKNSETTETTFATNNNSSILPKTNTTMLIMKADLEKINEDKVETTSKNRSIVKRNVDNSHLIFWNDMYDDEYGINVDHLENNIRDKHSTRGNNFVKSSSDWLQDKVRKFTDNFHKRAAEKDRINQRKSDDSSISGPTIIFNKPVNKINKRDTNTMSAEGDGEKVDFAALTANMKEVCKKAAQAVQHTKTIEVREGPKEAAVTSTLMQQLVRLMTDLVDFQVEQKTCLTLPPDLKNFLEWLLSSDKNEKKRGSRDSVFGLESVGSYDRTPEDLEILTTTTEKGLQSYDRSECLGALHSVEDLIQQYESMDDGDKTKITGVKEYLDNQLNFLQKQLNCLDFYKTYQKVDPVRSRRSLSKNELVRNRKRARRNLNKFLRNFGKKYTKTTANIHEVSTLNDVGSKDKSSIKNHKIQSHYKNMERNSNDKNIDVHDLLLTQNENRNLKDVYYTAVTGVKKSTTIKQLH